MAEPDGCGRLVISNMVLSRMSSRLATITSISSNTDFSLREKNKEFRKWWLNICINLSLMEKGGTPPTFPNTESKIRGFENLTELELTYVT